MGGNASASSFGGFGGSAQSFGGGAPPMMTMHQSSPSFGAFGASAAPMQQRLMCAQSSPSFAGFGASAAAPAASFGNSQPAASQMFGFGGSAPPPPPPASRASFEAQNREGSGFPPPPSGSNMMGMAASASFSTEVDSTAQVCSLSFFWPQNHPHTSPGGLARYHLLSYLMLSYLILSPAGGVGSCHLLPICRRLFSTFSNPDCPAPPGDQYY